jgi:hypothetical protein
MKDRINKFFLWVLYSFVGIIILGLVLIGLECLKQILF